jgi:5-(carboxyamino)imidazole ribonucleotide synthase
MSNLHKIVIPPQAIGIMGGGQLGRMLAIEAKQMGYTVIILDPNINCPASKFADCHIKTAFNDLNGLDELIKLSDVITTEFENVPLDSLKYLNQKVNVFPHYEAVKITQNRILEKQFFNKNGIPTTKFTAINSHTDINATVTDLFPGILKTTTLGYDGKGQIKVANLNELASAFLNLQEVPCILEKVVELKLEVSIIVARNTFEKSAYLVTENQHINGILDITIAPARIDDELQTKITQIALQIIEQLDYIGVLAIEFFIDSNNNILANEMAPRPHNSGHYTINASLTSQFEQQLRAICNLKLGKTDLTQKAVMLNLLGDIWQSETIEAQWDKILTKYDNLKLHLYEKNEAKRGRKMGHLTILGHNLELLIHEITEIKQILINN